MFVYKQASNGFLQCKKPQAGVRGVGREIDVYCICLPAAVRHTLLLLEDLADFFIKGKRMVT